MKPMPADADISSGRVLHAFACQGKRFERNQRLDADEVLAIPVANRRALVDGGFLKIIPRGEARSPPHPARPMRAPTTKPRKSRKPPPLIINHPPGGGGTYIISPLDKKPRSLSGLAPELARQMIQQHDGRDAVRIFGAYHWGAELVRRHKAECKNSGRKYSREDAINDAADRVGLGRDALRHWMNRSRRDR
jgi:hypothetical protein